MEQRNFLTTTRGIFLTAMVCCFLWGSAFPCVKIGYELFRMDTDHIPTLLLYAGLRFTLAGVLGVVGAPTIIALPVGIVLMVAFLFVMKKTQK